jgi:hypothetical protein
MRLLQSRIAEATAEAALALGLVRILTLLPLYDEALNEVEQHLAQSWAALLELRRLLEDDRVMSSGRVRSE